MVVPTTQFLNQHYHFIGIILLFFTFSIQAQHPRNLHTVRSGSGSIFGNAIVPYSSIDYQKEAVSRTSERAEENRQLERYVNKKRRSKIEPKPIKVTLRFHNHTRLNESIFERQVSIQIESLDRDFRMNIRTQTALIKYEEPPTSDIKIIDFITTENSYRPQPIIWKDWTSITDLEESEPSIDIHVIDNLPEELGHGYARQAWIDNPRGTDIVIRASSFGSGSRDFSDGKVLTHLLANYFGLYALTGPTNGEDDRVLDTPIHHAGASFCLEGKQPVSLVDNQYFLTNNFMSHSPDTCKDSFTPGQWRRMIFIIDYLNKNRS